MAFLIICIAAVVMQVESIFIKKYNEKYTKGGFIFTAILSFFSMLFFIIADFIFDGNGLQFEKTIIIYGVISGVIFALASMLTFIALGSGSFVLSRLILSYGILIAVFQGLILGEQLSVFGWIGIGLVVVSLYLVNGKSEDGTTEKIRITKKWVITITLSVLLAGAFGVLQRQQQKQFNYVYDNEFMIVTLAVSTVFLMTVGIIKDGKDIGYILKKGFRYYSFAGLSNGGTNFLQMFAYSLAPMSFVAPVDAGVGILISFIVAKLLFKEKFTIKQYIGVALGAIAVILFNI